MTCTTRGDSACLFGAPLPRVTPHDLPCDALSIMQHRPRHAAHDRSTDPSSSKYNPCISTDTFHPSVSCALSPVLYYALSLGSDWRAGRRMRMLLASLLSLDLFSVSPVLRSLLCFPTTKLQVWWSFHRSVRVCSRL